jgi:YVTN family beta-propeller protein
MTESSQWCRAACLALALLPEPAGSAPYAYITESAASNVKVVDTASQAVVANIRVGALPFGVAVSVGTSRVYVTNLADGTVSVIDALSNAVIATIAVGSSPTGVVVNSAGTRVYVANTGEGSPSDTVSVIDTASNTVTATIRAGSGPTGLALSLDGSRLYVANALSETITVVDTASQTVQATVPLGSAPFGVALDATRSRLYAALRDRVAVVDTASHAIVGTVSVGGGALGIAVDPAGARAYVANAGSPEAPGNTVSVIDTSTLAVVATVQVGSMPHGVAVHPIAGRVYVTNFGSGTVSVIDSAANSVAATISSGPGPVSFGSFIGVASSGAAPANYQALWWRAPAASESGWGVNITHQGDTLFATWFTYDTDGSGLWLVMSNGEKTGAGTYSGALYRTTGPAFDASPWNPSQVVVTPVGTATFAFSSADSGTFTYTVNGVTQMKPITRQVFASVPTCTAGGAPGTTPNYSDLWWRSPAGAESGWGVNIAHQGDILFATWFTYATGGRGQWLVMSNGARTAPGTYSGALYRTTGPAFSANPWNPSQVTVTPVGTATFTFGDSNSGTFAYTVDGISQTKPITRQAYATPPTVCR